MNQEDLDKLKSNDTSKILTCLKSFSEKNLNLFDFTEFNTTGQWPVIFKLFFSILQNNQHSEAHLLCLTCIRILSRNTAYLNLSIEAEQFDYLLVVANLLPKKSIPPSNTNIAVETLKCLCNMVFLSGKCRELCSRKSVLSVILNRVNNADTFPYEIEYFEMKLLFLITALNINARPRVCDDLNGLTYLSEWLDHKSNELNRSVEQIDLICEILKVLFNITVTSDNDGNSDEHEIQYRRLTSIVRNILLSCSQLSNEKEIELVSNAVNLLTNIPTICLSELLAGQTGVPALNDGNVKLFEGKCVLAADVLLNYFQQKLNNMQQYEILAPILTVLVKCVRSNNILRHYVRSVILPPLKDVKNRPEVGTQFRNHLCRFLTLPERQIRELAAELLFVCCKENIGRMIKHTGFGNAAGLLANRGLLGCRSNNPTEYSSDSDDSDTEEYKKYQHGINPVVGCYEPPRPNPMEGMSEEQKEYEAMQLVNLMDKLNRQGIVQPCYIGADGKPKPIDHILQLQEGISKQQFNQNNTV